MSVEGGTEGMTIAQTNHLLEIVNQIAAGQIEQHINMESFSGVWLELASGIEAIRQLVFSFYCELQVTYAQVSSSKEEIGETVNLVNGLALSFNHLRNDAAHMENDIQGLNDTLDSGQSTIEKTGAVIDLLQVSSGEINSIMQNANGRLDALIPVIVKTDDILAQIDKNNRKLKLLSFNTAIEAAHAGIHGKGITVIAQEMRRLSEESNNNVEKTGEINGQIKDEIAQLVTAMNSSQEQVHSTFNRVYEEVGDNLHAQQHTVSQILRDIADNKERTESFTHQLSQQFSLWADALESLKNSSQLFEKIEEALTTTLDKVAQNDYGLSVVNDDNLTWIIEHLHRLVRQEEILDLSSLRHKEVLSAFLDQQKDTVEAIYTTDSEGNFIFSQPTAALANARVRIWWKEAMSGKIYKSPVYISAITRKPCLTVALPILGNGVKRIGVLGVDLAIHG